MLIAERAPAEVFSDLKVLLNVLLEFKTAPAVVFSDLIVLLMMLSPF